MQEHISGTVSTGAALVMQYKYRNISCSKGHVGNSTSRSYTLCSARVEAAAHFTRLCCVSLWAFDNILHPKLLLIRACAAAEQQCSKPKDGGACTTAIAASNSTGSC